jgi:ribosomal protein S19
MAVASRRTPFARRHPLEKGVFTRKRGRIKRILLRRDSTIPPELVGLTIPVPTGGYPRVARLTVSEDMVGHKVDEFLPEVVPRAKIRPGRKTRLSRPAVIKVVERRALAPSAYALGPRARALLKGVEIAEEDLRNSGGSYDLEQVRLLLHGVSRQRVDSRVRDGSLLAVPGPSNKRRYPAVQFDDDGAVVEGLRQTQNALPTKNGFAVLNFLVRPEDRLGGRRPIDLLKAGEVDLVVEAARRLGEQGA